MRLALKGGTSLLGKSHNPAIFWKKQDLETLNDFKLCCYKNLEKHKDLFAAKQSLFYFSKRGCYLSQHSLGDTSGVELYPTVEAANCVLASQEALYTQHVIRVHNTPPGYYVPVNFIA